MARERWRAVHALAGHPADYAGEPAQVVLFVMQRLLREYAAAGGDLGDMQMTVAGHRPAGWKVVLDGYLGQP